MSEKPDDSGLEKLKNLFKELQGLNGRNIKETTFPMHSFISKTPKNAEERAAYEAFLRESKIMKDKVDIIGVHFINDMFKKHIG